MSAAEKDFGVEPESTYGLLTTLKEVDKCQTYDEAGKKYVGKFPSIKGDYVGYYADVAAAVRGEKELVVDPKDSRDGIRVIELARESHTKGVTVKWS